MAALTRRAPGIAAMDARVITVPGANDGLGTAVRFLSRSCRARSATTAALAAAARFKSSVSVEFLRGRDASSSPVMTLSGMPAMYGTTFRQPFARSVCFTTKSRRCRKGAKNAGYSLCQQSLHTCASMQADVTE